MRFTLAAYIYLLISLGLVSFFLYVVATILKNLKKRNEYLKDIRDELRISNSKHIE